MRIVLTLLVLGGLFAGLFALGTYKWSPEDKPVLHVADEVALTVNTAKPEARAITRIVQAPGDVEAVLEVEVSSEIVAKIEEMPVEEGDHVQKGDLLCRLDDDDLRAQVESGEARCAQLAAAIEQAEADLEKATRDVDRQMKLSEADATSDLEMRDYLTTKKKIKAMCEMRRQEKIEADAFLKRAKENLERTIIRAPISGVISKLSVKQGEVVVTGTMNNPGTVIMTISDLSKMQVKARVDEVDVPLVKSDQKARVYLQADQEIPVPARVVRVSAKGTKAVGRDVVTFEALLEVLSSDSRIKPAMTANVEIEVDRREEAVTVPIEAIVHRMRKDLPDEIVAEFDKKQSTVDLSDRARQAQYIKVLYVMDNEAAKVRLVDAGIADTRRVEIKEGVAVDDTIIIGPYRSLDQLKDGKKVKLSDDDKKKLAAANGNANANVNSGDAAADTAQASAGNP